MGDAAGVIHDRALKDLDERFNSGTKNVRNNMEQVVTAAHLGRFIDVSPAFAAPPGAPKEIAQAALERIKRIKERWLGLGPDSEDWFKSTPQDRRARILARGYFEALRLREDTGKRIETHWVCSSPRNAPPRFEVAIVEGKEQITVLLLCEPEKAPPSESAVVEGLSQSLVIGTPDVLREHFWLGGDRVKVRPHPDNQPATHPNDVIAAEFH